MHTGTPTRSQRNKQSPLQQAQSNLRQKQRRRRKNLCQKIVELTSRKHAQVYISIELDDQYFILNTDSSGTWPPPEEQIERHYPNTVRKTPGDYRALTSTKLRRETIFKKSVEYSDICGANVHTIIYINNRYFTLYTNGKPPPSAEQLVWSSEPKLHALADEK
ncbi:hypothetical protein AJ80_04036 [Polytolypa hystricis UAMH7299]|uniref:Uncharacterized protein n=1 Tax=Polytolypa hystricis (strain UAMH7299) TaxID=1447883 RepID=A0A2B7YE17_POLH7|nr:hypothetical protein AJ80_04036 [Polytolypa hystricis UAMH7299]